MTTKHLTTTTLLLLMISACTAPPRYVPAPSEVGTSTRGSYIIVDHVSSDVRPLKGELIAVEEKDIYVMTVDTPDKQLLTIDVNNVKNYKLKYAYSNRYNWAPPVFGIFSIFHGWYLIFTLPINLITTSLISSGSSFQYSQKSMPIYLLHRYARFPQGLPQGFDLNYLE